LELQVKPSEFETVSEKIPKSSFVTTPPPVDEEEVDELLPLEVAGLFEQEKAIKSPAKKMLILKKFFIFFNLLNIVC
jgi:hypothetical protein